MFTPHEINNGLVALAIVLAIGWVIIRDFSERD